MKKKEIVRSVKQVMRLSEETPYDRIVKWYAQDGNFKLTEQEETQRNRYEKAFAILGQAWTNEDTITKLMKVFDISRPTACRDIREAKRLFGDVNKSSKEGERYLLCELILKGIKKAWKGGASPDMDNYHKLIKLYAEIKGFDRDDAEAPDFTKLEQHTFVIVTNPQEIGLEKTPDINALLEKYKIKRKLLDLQQIEEAHVVK